MITETYFLGTNAFIGAVMFVIECMGRHNFRVAQQYCVLSIKIPALLLYNTLERIKT
jgi:hypothetical protein